MLENCSIIETAGGTKNIAMFFCKNTPTVSIFFNFIIFVVRSINNISIAKRLAGNVKGKKLDIIWLIKLIKKNIVNCLSIIIILLSIFID